LLIEMIYLLKTAIIKALNQFKSIQINSNQFKSIQINSNQFKTIEQ